MPPVRNSGHSDVFKRDVGVRRTMWRMMDFDLLQIVGTDQRRLATWKDLPCARWKIWMLRLQLPLSASTRQQLDQRYRQPLRLELQVVTCMLQV